VIHADDAALSLMFDVAGGALRRFRVELRRLLRPEIGARMAGETGPGFDAGVWQAVHWPAKDWCALESGPGETSCATRPASLGASDRIRIATAATITSRAAMKTA
jgi:hypothetical protein